MDLMMRPNLNGIMDLSILFRNYGTLVDQATNLDELLCRLLTPASTTIPSISSCPSVDSSSQTPPREA